MVKNKLLLSICAVMLINICVVLAENKQNLYTKEKADVAIAFECTTKQMFPKKALNKAVKITTNNLSVDMGFKWGNVAYQYDLDSDNKWEYFVPLDCNAFGNCIWGIYSLHPTKELGLIEGEYIYLRKSVNKWPSVISAIHVSFGDKILRKYCYMNGKYQQCKKDYYVSSLQNNVPKFMVTAQLGCD